MVPDPSGVVSSPKTPTQGRRGSRPLLIRSKPRHSHPQDEATSATTSTSAHSSSPMTVRTTASASSAATHHMDNRSPSKSLRRSKSSKWQDQLLRYQAFRRKVPFTDLSLSPQPSQSTHAAAQKQRRRQQYKDQKRAFLSTSASSLLTTHTAASAATTATTATATTSTEELPPRSASALSSRNLMQQQRQEQQQQQQQRQEQQQQQQQSQQQNQQSFLQPLQASPSGLTRQQMMVLQQQLDTLQEHYLSLLTEKETQQAQLRLAVEQWKMLQQTYQQQRMENQQLVEQKESMNQLQQQLNVLIRQQQQAYQHHLAETQSNLHQAQRALEQSQGKVVHLQKQAKALQARLRKETQAEQEQQEQQQQQGGASKDHHHSQQHPHNGGHQPQQHRRLSSDSSHFQEEVKQLTRETNQLRAEQLATNAAYRRSGNDPKAPVMAMQALQQQLDQAKATEQRQRLALELERQNSFRLTKQLSVVHMEKEQLQQELETLKQEVQNGSVGGGSSGGGGGAGGAGDWDLQRLKDQIQVLQSENQKQRKTIVELKNRSPTVVVVAEEEDDEMNSLDGVVEGQAHHRHRKKHQQPTSEELEDSMDSMSWQQSQPSGLSHPQDHHQQEGHATPQSPPTTAKQAPQGPPDTIDFTDALSERRDQSRTLVQITSMFLPTPNGGGSGSGSGGGTPPEPQHTEPLASGDDDNNNNYYFPPMSPSPRSQPRYIKAALSGRSKELEQSLSTFTTVSELTMPEDDYLVVLSAKRSQPKGSVLANNNNNGEGDDDDDDAYDYEGDLKNNVSALIL